VYRLAIAAACAVVTSGAAHAQRYVPSGQSVKLTFVAAVNPDCSPAGMPTVRVTQGPQHGRVNLVRGRDFVYFQPSNIRSVCNQRRVSGIGIHYQSQRGYTGYDAVGLEVFFPTGTYRRGTFNVVVR
jgi:hypothetical protein